MEENTMILTDMNILLIAFIMYIICLVIAYRFNIRWLFASTSVLWFIPILMIDNIFIVVFSVIMIIGTFVITFYNSKGDDVF